MSKIFNKILSEAPSEKDSALVRALKTLAQQEKTPADNKQVDALKTLVKEESAEPIEEDKVITVEEEQAVEAEQVAKERKEVFEAIVATADAVHKENLQKGPKGKGPGK